MLTIGSMFSGLLGGLDIACERVFDAETAWQLDITGASVRRRHWPGVLQVEADVTTVDPADLARVDVLCGGFPCQDLSHAGKMAGLDGPQSGLYRHVLRFARVLGPQYVVLENVGGLLKYMPRLGEDFRALGYGLTYAVVEAADAGLPHLRRRVFVVAEYGVDGRGRVEVDGSRRWSAVESEREWATILASEAEGRRVSIGRRDDPDMLSEQVRPWDTPRANPGGSGRRGGARGHEEMLDAQVRERPTVTAVGGQGEAEKYEARRAGRQHWSGPNLPTAVVMGQGDPREWATATATDYKTPAGFVRQGHQPARIGEQFIHEAGKRLNPAWVETLMGVPQGWTLPTGPSLRDQLDAWRAPRGRYPATWDRSVPWPGFAWEPSRTLPDGPPCPGRPARIKGLGNGVVWQAAELGIGACIGESVSEQLDLFAAVAR